MKRQNVYANDFIETVDGMAKILSIRDLVTLKIEYNDPEDERDNIRYLTRREVEGVMKEVDGKNHNLFFNEGDYLDVYNEGGQFLDIIPDDEYFINDYIAYNAYGYRESQLRFREHEGSVIE